MEAAITAIIAAMPAAALPIVVTVLGLGFIYWKIQSQRKVTKAERDTDAQTIHDKLLTHDFKISELQGIVNLHRDKLDSIDKQLGIVNQELVKLNIQVEHLAKALERQNEIMMEQMKK